MDATGPVSPLLKVFVDQYDSMFMDVIAFGARALLVLVFAVAAVGKLVDRDATRRALNEFHVPQALAPPMSWLLPVAELGVAIVLLIQPFARGASVAAAVFLTLFFCGIAAAMRRGEAPDCNCFGQIGSRPAGKETLVRNAALTGVAVLVAVYGPGLDPGSWFKALANAEIAILLLVIVGIAMAAATVSLLNERRMLRRDLTQAESTLALFPSGLPVGVDAPSFSLPGTDGARVTLSDLVAHGRPIALTFVSPSCLPCKFMFPDISGWQRSLSERLTIALVAHGTLEEIREMATTFGLSNLLSDPEGTVFRAYRGAATPSMLIINADGKIGTRIRSSQGVVEAALRTALKHAPAEGATATSPIHVERWSGRDVQQPA